VDLRQQNGYLHGGVAYAAGTTVTFTDGGGQTRALRTVARTRGDLVEMRVAVTSQLTGLLDAHRPDAKPSSLTSRARSR
jgi:hypothetical protein